ncbi:hypothetical protein ACOMHN_048667 [Nucella lapillus]
MAVLKGASITVTLLTLCCYARFALYSPSSFRGISQCDCGRRYCTVTLTGLRSSLQDSEQDNCTAADALMCFLSYEPDTVRKPNSTLSVRSKPAFLCGRKYYECEDMFILHFAVRFNQTLTEVLKPEVLVKMERVVPGTVCLTCLEGLAVTCHPSDWNISCLLNVSSFFCQNTTTQELLTLSQLLSDLSFKFFKQNGHIFWNRTTQNVTLDNAKCVNHSEDHSSFMPDGKDFPEWFRSVYYHSNHQAHPSKISTAWYLMYDLYMLVVITAVLYKFRKDYTLKDNPNINSLAFHHCNLLVKWHWNEERWKQKSFAVKKLCVCCNDAKRFSSSKQTSLTDVLKEFIFSPWLTKSGVANSFRCDNFMTVFLYPVTRFLPDPTYNPDIDFSHVAYRLATLGALPRSVSVSMVRLADAGFYYRGHNEEVTCYSCHVRHSDWSREGDPMEIHRELSPNCQHILARDRELAALASEDNRNVRGNDDIHNSNTAAVNNNGNSDGTHTETRHATPEENRTGASSNAAATTESRSISTVEDTEPDGTSEPPVDGNSEAQRSRCLFPQPRLDLGQAVYPMYQNMAGRRRTFTNPWDESRLPPLEDVVQSGMFYAGYADCVRCFFCGVGLKNWVVTDDVWTEHIRWRPTCQFLKTIKGDDFIRSIQRQLGTLNSSADAAAQQIAQGPSQTHTASPQPTATGSSSSHTTQAQPAPATALTSSSGASSSGTTSSSSSTIVTSSTTANSLPSGAANSLPSGAANSLPSGAANSLPSGAANSLPSVTASSRGRRCPASGGEGGADPSEGRRGGEGGLEGEGRVGTDGADDPDGSAMGAYLARLQAENRQLASQTLCRVCHRPAAIDTLLLPCGHLVVCSLCAASITACPLCHSPVHATTRVYLQR